MRVYRSCFFFIGTKIPFSQWPALVDRYLDNLGLSYQAFLYDFEDMDFSAYYQKILSGESCRDCRKLQACEFCREEAQQALRKKSACERALADCPALGPIFLRQEKDCCFHILSNLSFPGKEVHDLLLPLMPKLHKCYGFSEISLCYHGVDFFSRSWPSAIDASRNELTGPRIVLHRWTVSPRQSGIELCIDITDGDEVLDASPYLDAMAALLPGIRHWESLDFTLAPEEQAELERIERQSESAVSEWEAFFKARFSSPRRSGSGPVSLAPALKRLGQAYSYRYLGSVQRLLRMEKPSPNGHFLTLEFDTGRMGDEVNVLLSLEGAGFSRRIAGIPYLPESRQDAVSHLEKLFAALHEAEALLLPALDCLYPAGPVWYTAARNT